MRIEVTYIPHTERVYWWWFTNTKGKASICEWEDITYLPADYDSWADYDDDMEQARETIESGDY